MKPYTKLMILAALFSLLLVAGCSGGDGEVIQCLERDGVRTCLRFLTTGQFESEPKKSESKAAGGSDASSEEALDPAVTGYYEAVYRQDWNYTYDELDSQTRQRFTRDEWTRKNQYFAAVYPLVTISPTTIVGPEGSPSRVKVTVFRTFQNLPSNYRDTYFVYENGSWKHRFSQEEYDLFMADASVEEFKRNR